MFGELVAAYLFLAGTGAGGIAAACLADLLAVRTPFGAMAAGSVAEARPADRLVAFALAASVAALALGCACLTADLGRLDRVLALFLTPSLTLMNLGAWALAALLAVGALLALARFAYLPWLGRSAAGALEVAAVALAAVVAVYAGLLLQMLPGVRLWSSPWVPALFVLSAASCGCALLAGTALFVEDDGEVRRVVRVALAADAALVIGELVAAAAFLAGALGSGHPGVATSAESLLHGSAALPWWCGFALCGVAAPLLAEGALWWRARSNRGEARGPSGSAPALAPAPAVLAALAALVLVGGAGLRWAIVDAGAHRPLELQDPAASALSGGALADDDADMPRDASRDEDSGSPGDADTPSDAADAPRYSAIERKEPLPWSS